MTNHEQCKCESTKFEGIATTEYCSIHKGNPNINHEQIKQVSMQARFRQIGAGSIRFIATRMEVLEFIEKEINLAIAAKLDEVEKKIINAKIPLKDIKESYECSSEIEKEFNAQHLGYNQALSDALKVVQAVRNNK